MGRVARADLSIWPDRPVAVRLARVLRRTLKDLGATQADLPEGCPERLANLPQFIRFIWTTRHTARARIEQLVATAPPSCRVVHLCSDGEVEAYARSCWSEISA